MYIQTQLLNNLNVLEGFIHHNIIKSTNAIYRVSSFASTRSSSDNNNFGMQHFITIWSDILPHHSFRTFSKKVSLLICYISFITVSFKIMQFTIYGRQIWTRTQNCTKTILHHGSILHQSKKHRNKKLNIN